jgi:hypothetical protein
MPPTTQPGQVVQYLIMIYPPLHHSLPHPRPRLLTRHLSLRPNPAIKCKTPRNRISDNIHYVLVANLNHRRRPAARALEPESAGAEGCYLAVLAAGAHGPGSAAC